MDVTVRLSESDGLVATVPGQDILVGIPREADTRPRVRSTELLLMALGTCMLGNVHAYAERKGIPLARLEARLTDEVVQGPERIGCIVVAVELGNELSKEHRKVLQRVAERCKIHNTLEHPPEIRFIWDASDPGGTSISSPDARQRLEPGRSVSAEAPRS